MQMFTTDPNKKFAKLGQNTLRTFKALVIYEQKNANVHD